MHERLPSGFYHIGPFILDTQLEVLLRDGKPMPLGRRAVALLLRLVQTPGDIVDKEALYQAAWPGQTVEESNLTVQISQLRRVLRESSAGESWIETVPRRGYRFTGPVAGTAREAASVSAHGQAVSNIPVAVPLHFTGRAESLAAIAAALGRPAPAPSIVALHGLRGLGKTILAAAYAHQTASSYRATWWVRAEAEVTIRADLAALAARLGWIRPDAPEGDRFTAALSGLQADGDGLLLIYDNAVDAPSLRPFIPTSGGARLIITSNAAAWRAYATPIEPALWPAAMGADFLIARTGREAERDEALALSGQLEGLPLAHEQAASYVENVGVAFAEYRRRLADAPVRLLDNAAFAPADYHGGLTVAKALHLAIGQAETRHPAARALLAHAALLPPEPIPVQLFEQGAEDFGASFAAQTEADGLDRAIAVLRGLALVTSESVPDERDAGLRTEALRLHRLVRQIVGATLAAGPIATGRAALIAALVRVYPANVFDSAPTWPLARRLDALAMAMVAPPAPIPPGAEADASDLLNRLASFRSGALALFDPARLLLERALDLSERSRGPDDPRTASIVNNLGLLHRDYGDLAVARPLLERALAIRLSALGERHRDVAATLNNVGNVIAEQGDPAASLPLMQRALAIQRDLYGEHDPRTAQYMHNVARHLHYVGDLDASWPMHQRALAIREEQLGLDHPHTANSLTSLAMLLLDRGDWEEAERLSARALRVNEASFGADHPTTGTNRVVLAQCQLARGDHAAALLQAERGYAAVRSALTVSSRHVRSAASVLASCLEVAGDRAAADELRRRHGVERTGEAAEI